MWCSAHCELESCHIVAHKVVRDLCKARCEAAAAEARRTACTLTQYDLLEAGHVEKCSDPNCSKSFAQHARGAPRKRAHRARADTSSDDDTGGAAAMSTAERAARRIRKIRAKLKPSDLGLEEDLFAAHPYQFRTDDWDNLLIIIKGKSKVQQRIDKVKCELKMEMKQGKGKDDDPGASLRYLFYLAAPRTATLRTTASLLSIRAALQQLERAGTPIVFNKADIVEDASGTVSAIDALSESLINTLEIAGTRWIRDLIERLHTQRKGDAYQYVVMSKKTAGKRSCVKWVERYAKVLLAGYPKYLDTLPIDHPVPTLAEILSTFWTLPLRDTVLPYNLRPLLVTAGVLALVRDTGSEATIQSLSALETHVTHAFAQFYNTFVLSSGNQAEYKRFLEETTQPKQGYHAPSAGGRGNQNAGGRGRDTGGGRGNRDHGRGNNAGRGSANGSSNGGNGNDRPPLQDRNSNHNGAVAPAIPSSTTNTDRKGQVPPGAQLYPCCQHPGCSKKPPNGPSTFPYCRAHENGPLNGRAGTAAAAGALAGAGPHG